MEHMMSKLSENILDKFSMDFLRNQVLKKPTATMTPSSPPWTPAFSLRGTCSLA